VAGFLLVGITQSALWTLKLIGVYQAIMISVKAMTTDPSEYLSAGLFVIG
jgi:hypothetical protein